MRDTYLVGKVNMWTAKSILKRVRALDQRKGPIHMVLASTGGSEDAGWVIYDALCVLANEVRVEAFGVCQSMAMLILQAGELRLVSPNCRLMLHNGNISISATIDQMRSIAPEVEFLMQRYYEVLGERSGQSVNAIKKLCDKETYLSAEEAVQMGLADGILTRFPKKDKK